MRRAVILAAAAAAAAGCAATQPAPKTTGEVRHVFLTAGHKTGSQTLTRAPDGSFAVRFEFADRGRGPDITTTYVLGEGGVPTKVECRGVDYYKVAVNETFVVENNTARWKNASEDDSAPVKSRHFISR